MPIYKNKKGKIMNFKNNIFLKSIVTSKSVINYCSISLLVVSTSTFALDVDPGDYAPLPDGSNLGLLYYKSVKRDSIYSDKHKVSSNSKLNTDVTILRAVHYKKVNDYLMNFQILLPAARFSTGGDISGLGKETGIGDPILASTIFLNKDGTAHNSFGIAQYLTLPVGSYRHKRDLNVGENRWQYVLQAGYTGALTENVFYDLTGDVTLFGKNSKFTEQKLTLKQKPKYQLQTYLRYKTSDTSEIYAGYSQHWKGETRVDKDWQRDVSNQQKFMLGASYFLTNRTQILGTLGGDTAVDNGFKEKTSVSLRLLHVF